MFENCFLALLSEEGNGMKYMKKLLSVLLTAALSVNAAACGAEDAGLPEGTVNLTDSIKTTKPVRAENLEQVFITDSADFYLSLLKENLDSAQNVMVSPVSVQAALSMTANGAKGDTLEQMRQTCFPNQTLEEMNENMAAFHGGLVSTDSARFQSANSIWFSDKQDRIKVEESFLTANAQFYGADIYKSPFDNSTLEGINAWVKDKTDGVIDTILDKIPESAVMYLLNAAAFDAQWLDVYKESDIREGKFTDAQGVQQNVQMMYSREQYYLEDDHAAGFRKPYKEGYSFVALLPEQGMSPEEYVSSLTGESFLSLLRNETQVSVNTVMPKFTAEYEADLSDMLQAMGMELPFDDNNADLSGIGSVEDLTLYISRVLHKTYISVDGMGTKAGAATAVEVAAEGAAMETRFVSLDRPFVYAVIDDQTKLPIFIGVLNKAE